MRISDWSSDVCSSDLAHADLFFERFDPRFQRVRIVAGGGGHRLYRFEFVAAHEVGSADEFANALAHRGLGFAPNPGQRADRAVYDFGKVVEKEILRLNGNPPEDRKSTRLNSSHYC